MNESTAPTRLLVQGASGRMGQAVLRLAAQPGRLLVVGAVTGAQPPQRVADGVPYFAARELHGAPAFDVAIDFSLPPGFDRILALCVERGAALVYVTAGLGGAAR